MFCDGFVMEKMVTNKLTLKDCEWTCPNYHKFYIRIVIPVRIFQPRVQKKVGKRRKQSVLSFPVRRQPMNYKGMGN